MPIQTLAPQIHNVALNQDFGHQPVGRLGQRQVQQMPGQGARAAGQAGGAQLSFGARVQSLGTRVLNALTPHGMRAEQKVRTGLEQTSRQVGDLLGALSKTKYHPVDGATVRQLMLGLPSTATPVTSRGASFEQVFSQRVELNLQNMTTPELVALREGLALAKSSALTSDPATAAQLDTIDRSAHAEVTARVLNQGADLLQPLFEKAVAQLPREAATPGAVDYVFSQVYGAASRVLDAHGVSDGGGRASKDLQRALVLDVLSAAVEKEGADLAGLGGMICKLPSSELRALADNTLTVAGEVPFSAQRMVQGAIGLRAQQTEASFLSAADTLLAHREPAVDDAGGPLHNPQGFAAEVVSAARHLSALTKDTQLHDMVLGAQVDPKVAQLHAHLEELLRPSNLLLVELNHQQLYDFSAALQSLGIERGSPQIAAEITRRKDEAHASYGTTVQTLRNAVAAGDLVAVLRAARASSTCADDVSLTFQKLGADLDGADQAMQFKEDLMKGALAALPLADLGQIFAMVSQPEMKSLVASLGDLGHELMPNMRNMDGENPALGKALVDASVDMVYLTEGVHNALTIQGVNLPDLPDESNYGLTELTARARAAIKEGFGVEVGSNGQPRVMTGLATPAFQAVFEGQLRDIEARPMAEQRLEGGRPSGVCDGFWKDLSRASYSLEDAQGGRHALLDHAVVNAQSGAAREVSMMGAVARLRELAGGDDNLLMALSQFSNQGALSGLQMAQMGKDSPFCLPDGTRGLMNGLSGAENTAYTLASDGEGGIVIRYDLSLDPASMFINPETGQQTRLDPAHSKYRFTAEVSISKDREVRVSQPVQFLFELKLATWDKDYPCPSSVEEVLASTDQTLRADFRDHLRAEFSVENLDYLDGVAALARNPTLEAARALANQFLGPAAQAQVNIEDASARSVHQKLNGEHADELDPAALLALFEPSRATITGVLKDPFMRFVTANTLST